MKKYIIFLSLLLIGGCSLSQKKGNILTCLLSENPSYGSDSHEIIIYEKDNKISSYSLTHKVIMNDTYQGFYEDYYNSITSGYDIFKDKNGVTLEKNKNDLSFTIKLNIDTSKIEENIKNNLMIDINDSLINIKTVLERDGYVCN